MTAGQESDCVYSKISARLWKVSIHTASRMVTRLAVSCRVSTYQVTYQVRSHLALFQNAGSTTSRVGGHQLSIKNPIRVDLNFCNPFLKALIVEAWTIWSSKLFHLLTTLFAKKYFRMSLEQLCLEIFTEWPLVRCIVSRTKKDSNGIEVKPLYSLNTSIRSDRFRLSSRVQSPRHSRRCK